ncbi:glycosyltransferase [Vibrio parahaemolyticus]|uniref:glycosyltransferase n=1 Tax=Vibrio parahaemolyticus TaxID=670 RepID=UPI00041CDBD8|nr:glycosyltransferase [Vibrio parahaemolyticus]
MKYTFVINSLAIGGAEKNCIALVNQFVEQNLDVELLVLTQDIKIKLSEVRCKVVIFENRRVLFSFFDLFCYIFKNRNRVILSFNHLISIMLLPISKLFGVNVITRNINNLSKYYSDSTGLELKLTKTLYRYCGKIICQSEGMKKDLIQNFRIKTENTRVINNPCLIEKIDLSNMVMKKCDNIKPFIFLGRLSEQKNLFDLLYIFQGYVHRGGQRKLEIYGDGYLKEDIKSLIIELGLEDVVSMKGNVENVISSIDKAAGLLLCSLYEGFPNVLVESICRGCPIISYDCDFGPREIIIPSINGLLVPHLNKSSFVDAMFEFEKIDWKKKNIIDSGERFSISNITDKYIEELSNV